MPDRHVVGLQVVVHRELPVHVPDFLGDWRKGQAFLQAIWSHLLGQGPENLARRGRIACEADEDEAKESLQPDRDQSVRRTVEVGKGLFRRHADQAAVVPIAPAVIGAGDRALAFACSVQHARAAVPADVMERLDRTVLVPDYDDTVRSHFQRDEIAGLRDGVDVADDLPARTQDSLVLQARHFRVAVDPCRHREPAGRFELGGGVHGPAPKLYGHVIRDQIYAGARCRARRLRTRKMPINVLWSISGVFCIP